MENGRCKLHGGKSLRGADVNTFKHGRYSKYAGALTEKIDAVSLDNALDLIPELQIQRALFADYMSRFKPGVSLTAGDIQMLMQWGSEIGRMVERIVKMRNETALTGAELTLLAARIADVVSKYIDDPEKQREFIGDIFAGLGQSESANTLAIAENSIVTR